MVLSPKYPNYPSRAYRGIIGFAALLAFFQGALFLVVVVSFVFRLLSTICTLNSKP